MSGMIYRRRYKRIDYPATVEEFTDAGYRADAFDPDFAEGGFWVKVLANPTGHDERTELQLRAAFLSDPNETNRADYLKELAARVTEWNYETEDADGTVTAVPAPADGDDGWRSFGLLPSMVQAWLTSEIQTAHRPKATTPTSGLPGTPDSPLDAGPTPEA
jgi:hypothetical protein